MVACGHVAQIEEMRQQMRDMDNELEELKCKSVEQEEEEARIRYEASQPVPVTVAEARKQWAMYQSFKQVHTACYAVLPLPL